MQGPRKQNGVKEGGLGKREGPGFGGPAVGVGGPQVGTYQGDIHPDLRVKGRLEDLLTERKEIKQLPILSPGEHSDLSKVQAIIHG